MNCLTITCAGTKRKRRSATHLCKTSWPRRRHAQRIAPQVKKFWKAQFDEGSCQQDMPSARCSMKWTFQLPTRSPSSRHHRSSTRSPCAVLLDLALEVRIRLNPSIWTLKVLFPLCILSSAFPRCPLPCGSEQSWQHVRMRKDLVRHVSCLMTPAADESRDAPPAFPMCLFRCGTGLSRRRPVKLLPVVRRVHHNRVVGYARSSIFWSNWPTCPSCSTNRR